MMTEAGVLNRLRSLVITECNSLPPDILRDILGWSKNLRELTLTDTNNLLTFPGWDVKSVLKMADLRRNFLTRLELSGPHIHSEHIIAFGKIPQLRLRFVAFRFAQLAKKTLIHFFRTQKYLEEIDVSFTDVTEKDFSDPQCTFQKVKKLSLAGFSDELEFLPFLSRMPNLEHINLSNSRSTRMTWENLLSGFLPAKLKKLECLDLSHNIPLGTLQQQNVFSNLVKCQKQITCLNLSGNPSVRDSLLNVIFWNLSNLKVLYLENLPNITNEGLIGIRHRQLTVAEKNNKLDFLNPSLLRYQNKNSAFVGHCQNLNTLSLAFCPRLTDLTIQFGVRFLPSLQNLKLTGLKRITDHSMYYLGSGCISLAMLDLSGTAVNPHWVYWAKFYFPYLRQVIVTDPPETDLAKVPSDVQNEFDRLNQAKSSGERGVGKSDGEEKDTIPDVGIASAGAGERLISDPPMDANNNMIV